MIAARLEKIALLLTDVDGVLTRGEVVYTDAGAEIKRFNVKDGLGIRLLLENGIKTGVVTGRTSQALRHRCKDLGIALVFDGVKHKERVLDTIVSETEIPADRIAFVGDDLPDIPLMKRVGFAIAVADAHETVKAHADLVTTRNGGDGAVREVCEAILKAKGMWTKIIASWEENT